MHKAVKTAAQAVAVSCCAESVP